jgi:hypothetical protein
MEPYKAWHGPGGPFHTTRDNTDLDHSFVIARGAV